MKSCLNEINRLYDSLSYSEKLLADFVLNNREKVIHMSVSEASDEIHLAKSTIVETTQKLGFSGWREFKITLATELVNPVENWRSDEFQDESNSLVQVVKGNMVLLKELSESIDYGQIEEIASMVLKYKRIVLFGVGTSNVLAKELYDCLFRLGINCVMYEDWHYQRLAATMLDKKDMAIMISQSGVNSEIVSLAEAVKKTGCKTVGLCNFKGTPFGKYMDILLAPLAEPLKTHDNNFTLRIPIFFLIDILYYAIAKKMGRRRYDHMLNLNHNLVKDSSV